MNIDILGPQIALYLCMAFAFGIALVGGFLSYKGLCVSKWPQVIGKIKEIGVEKTSDSDGTIFTPTISYTYEVNGITYSGSNWYYNSSKAFATEEKARKYIEPYKIGEELKVYINSKKPSRSVLIASIDSSAIIMLAFGIIIFLFCLIKYQQYR